MLAIMRFGLALLLLAAACGSHAKQSITLYEKGDYAGSLRAADEGLTAYPDDSALWGMRVRAALALGDGPAVGKAYGDYVAKHGGDDHELLRDLSEATLWQALGAPSAKLKIRAIEAVEELEISSLADDVAKQLGDDDDRVQATAAVAVLHGYKQALEVADAMLHSENAEARRIALEGVAKKIKQLAIDWTAHAKTDFDQVMAIQQGLLDPGQYRYDKTAQYEDSFAGLVDFLEHGRAGFCEQFASAVAVIISAISFGGASLLTLIASLIQMRRSRNDPQRKRGAQVGAIALSVVGMAAGIGLSYFLFVYGRR